MKKTATGLFLAGLFCLFILFPEEVKTGAQSGLFLWYNSVVPILLPFLILSGIMINTDSFSLLLQPLFSFLTQNSNFQPALFYPVFLGLFCGFPMGAKTIADLIESHSITKRHGNLLLPIVNQASPMFLAGFVGIHILKNKLSFANILFYLYVPPFTILFLRLFIRYFFKQLQTACHFGFSKRTTRKQNPGLSFHTDEKKYQRIKKNSMSLNLEHTIWNSFHIVVTIGIYMMLFTIASCLCTKILPENDLLSLFLCSLEFSTGLHLLSNMNVLDSVTQTGLILALTSFGGFCTAAQTSSLIKNTGLSMKSYLFWKCLIALGVFFLYSSSVSSS